MRVRSLAAACADTEKEFGRLKIEHEEHTDSVMAAHNIIMQGLVSEHQQEIAQKENVLRASMENAWCHEIEALHNVSIFVQGLISEYNPHQVLNDFMSHTVTLRTELVEASFKLQETTNLVNRLKLAHVRNPPIRMLTMLYP